MKLDLIGRRFDRLVVIGIVERTPSGVVWLCLCDCGNNVMRLTTSLRRGGRTGCKQCWLTTVPAALKHGDARGENHGGKATIYNLWKGMRQRCADPSHVSYKYYGGKGIKVCDAWADYPTFRDWALSNGYVPGLSIDRRDSDGDYSPENCEWVTRSENSRRQTRKPRLKLVAGGN